MSDQPPKQNLPPQKPYPNRPPITKPGSKANPPVRAQTKGTQSSFLNSLAEVINQFAIFLEKLIRTIIKEARPYLQNSPRKVKSSSLRLEKEKITSSAVMDKNTQEKRQEEQQINSLRSTNVNNLGYYLDGWADLVEGMGLKGYEVYRSCVNCLQGKDIPSWIQMNETEAYVSNSIETRPYIITTTSSGATTTICVKNHGQDLYVSWRTFLKPVLNDTLFEVIILIAIVLESIILVLRYNTSGFYQLNIPEIIIELIFILLVLLGLTMVVSRIFKGSFLALFFAEPTLFDLEDITAMSLTAHKSILRALDLNGIDIAKLRIKQEFKSGRRGEGV